MLLLEVNNLHASLRRGSIISVAKKRKLVLNGISFGVAENTSVGLLGASGSGKTTLAKCIVGLHRPDSGAITFEGLNLFPKTENRKSIRLEIQMLFQGSSASLDPSMTVLDSLLEGIGARNQGPSKADAIAEAEGLVASMGMSIDCLARLPRQLSGGQRQRIALARVLSVKPRLLILDEPTSALDALTSAQLLQLLKSLQAKCGFATLYITHDVKTALSFCDRVALLHEGRIVEEGTATEVYKRPKHDYTIQLLRDSRIAQS
ncbi:MAG: transporter ATP-binding protein [Bacteroidetes bacterium]|nr:transporter ATP-binding protein [Bacteroidota bacterium]